MSLSDRFMTRIISREIKIKSQPIRESVPEKPVSINNVDSFIDSLNSSRNHGS